MAKKAKEKVSLIEGLWIAPRNNLKGPTGERAWENRPGGAPSSNRFLELADIAHGLERTNSKKLALEDWENQEALTAAAAGYQSHKTF
jgi:hypothetical protein